MRTAVAPSWSWDVLITACAPIIWGSTYIVTTEILPADRPFTAALLRTAPAGLLLLLFARRTPLRSQWRCLLVLAALNIGVFQALLFVAAYRLPGGLAAVLGAIQPLLVMALTWLIDGQSPARVSVWAAVAGVLGMALLLLAPGARFDLVGAAAALAGAACMATGIWLTRRSKLDLPIASLTGWQLLLGGLMLSPAAALIDPPLPMLSSKQMMGYLYLCLAGALLSYTLWFRGIRRIPPVAASSLGLLSPLTAVLLGWVILSQTMTALALIGMALVFTSVLVVQWSATHRA